MTRRGATQMVRPAAGGSGEGCLAPASPPSAEPPTGARGAVMGARGNAGVIFSQIMAGMAHSLGESPTCDAHLLARALEDGTETAYRAVPQPVEGTILTVARAAGDAAIAAARELGAAA